MSYQIWIGEGNLTADPEMKYVRETPKTNFSIAINQRYGDKEDTIFVDIECWDKLAENVAEYKRKGEEVLVQGRWKMDEYEDREGVKRRKWYVRADTVRFVGGRGRDDEEDDRPRRSSRDDDRPRRSKERRRDDRDDEERRASDRKRYDDLPF